MCYRGCANRPTHPTRAVLIPLRSTFLFTATVSLVVAPGGPVAAAPAAHRVVVLSCDGAGAQMLGRAVAAGRMPQLAAIQAEGAAAAHARTAFGSRTASGHAALWTGAWGNVNGVSANQVPRLPLARHTILEVANGFEADALAAEPLFVTAARSGLRVLTFNVTHTTPLAAFVPGGKFGEGLGDRLMMLNGYLGLTGPEGTWDGSSGLNGADAWTGLPTSAAPPRELAGRVAGVPLYAAMIDDPLDPVQGYDTVLLSWNREGRAPVARLKPRAPRDDAAWSGPVRVPAKGAPALTFFRLFELDPTGQRVLLYHTPPARLVANGEAAPVVGAVAAGGFVEGSATDAYVAGRLGRTVADGGDGRAEERYLATTRFALARARAALGALVGRSDWDLLMTYVPFPDEAAHLWYGYVTPGSPAYDRALAPKLRPALDGVLTELDALLGTVRAAMPDDTALLIVGDHGMAPARWDFRPNVALRRAGLLALGRDGRVDLARTRAMYGPGDGAYVVVNTTAHKGGVVDPADVPAVLAEVRKAFGAITVKTPAGVVPLVRSWTEPTQAVADELGVGGRSGGEIYLDLQPGYAFDAVPTGELLFQSRPPNSAGAHVFDSRRAEIHAAFYAVGAGIKRGARLGGIRNIDVAPTAARLLGIRPPAQATGRALDEILLP